MLTTITVPANVKSGTRLSIGRWFRNTGDPVTLDEPIVEIESDNLTHEVRAPVTGILSEILLKDGEFITPSAVLGTIMTY